MNGLVILQNNQVVTSSLMVAEAFNKEHKNVLKAIDELNEGVAQKLADPLYSETEYTHDQNKQKYPMYFMGRDGFMLLVMGFTGKKALNMKLEFIEAFNTMERNLIAQLTDLNLINALEQVLELAKAQDSTFKSLAKKVESMQSTVDRIESVTIEEIKQDFVSNQLYTSAEIGAEYGMSNRAFNAMLFDLGVQFSRGHKWILYKEYRNAGKYKESGGTKWTHEGRMFLHDLLKTHGILPIETKGES